MEQYDQTDGLDCLGRTLSDSGCPISQHNYLPNRITGLAVGENGRSSLLDHRREIANDISLDQSAYFRSLQKKTSQLDEHPVLTQRRTH